RPIAIRDHGRLEVADLEAIKAIAVYWFGAWLTSVLRPRRATAEQRRCRCSNSQRGTGTKYTATGQDRRRFRHLYLQWEMGEPFGRVELIHVLQPLACCSCASRSVVQDHATAYQETWGGGAVDARAQSS